MKKCDECEKEYEEFAQDEVKNFFWFCCKECCDKLDIEDKKNREILKKETAKRILYLIRLGHPTEKGELYNRYQVMEEIENRGFDLLKELGWNTDLESLYKNRYTGGVYSLSSLIPPKKERGLLDKQEDIVNLGQLFSVLEHYSPLELWGDEEMFEEYKNKTTQESLF